MTVTQRAVSLLTGVALVFVILGTPLLLMTVPAYTDVLVVRVDSPARTGLDQAETRELAQEVRAFVAGGPGRTLPATLPDGRPAFDEKAVSHLEDVRDVLSSARIATVSSLVIAIAAGAWMVWRRRLRLLGTALVVAATLTITLAAFAVLLALFDFGRFFEAFHALFFDAGTWQFPHDALLIRLFPEPFWVVSGSVWGGLVLLGGVAAGFAGRAVLGMSEPHEA